MPTIIKDMGTFSAAHCLPNHNGLCKNLHGHNYKVIVSVVGAIKDSNGQNAPDDGMVLDFSVLKALYKEHIETKLDHAVILGTHLPPWYLNYRDLIPLDTVDELGMRAGGIVDMWLGKVAHLPIPETTAEWLATWMHETLNTALYAQGIQDAKVEWVQVWETPTSCAQSAI